MTTTKTSFINLADQIKVKNLITVSIDSEFLNMNFEIIKQCLTRLSQLQAKVTQEKLDRDGFNREIYQRLNYIQKDIAKNKEKIDENQAMVKDLQQSFGEDLKEQLAHNQKKFDELNQKSQNFHDIEKLVKQIEALNKFVSNERFKDFQAKTGKQLDDVNKIKDQLHKFVDNQNFNQFKNQTEAGLKNANDNIQKINQKAEEMDKQILEIDGKAAKASADAQQNNNMVKQINFADMQQKIKKFKQDTQNKLNQMAAKLKKKVGNNELTDVQKKIIEKLDTFLTENDNPKADQEQTKGALSFLQKRINQIHELFNQSGQQDNEMDALFATRKWMCASCTRDLGKYEGKMGQFKPWSIFPCRQLDPQKSGGYGFVNYIDKLAYKKGITLDDTNLDRLTKPFFQKTSKQQSPNKPQISTARATNQMSNFGTSLKNTTSLKDQYYKNTSTNNSKQKYDRLQHTNKFFRVRNHSRVDSDKDKEKVKDI